MPARRLIICFFYYALSTCARSQQPELILPVGHTEDIFLTEYSRDGKYIITCSYDNTAKLWEAYSGKLLHTFSNLLHDPDYGINTLVSKDRKYLIAQTTDGYLKKWELPSAKLIFSFKQATIPIAGFEAGADGKYILVKTGSTTFNSPAIVVLDAANGRFLYTLVTVNRNFFAEKNTELSPDGKFILRQTDSSLFLYQAATGKLVRKLEELDNFNLYSFSPDGKYIILFPRRSNQLRLWRTHDGDLRKLTVSGTIELSPDSRYILTTTVGSLSLLETESGEMIHVFETGSGRMLQGHFSHDGKYIFLSRNRGYIRGTDPYDSVTQIWETESGRSLYELNGKNRDINHVEFSPDHKYIATVAGDTRIWETATGSLLNILEGREVQFSPDGRTAAVTDQRKVRVFSMALNDTLAVLMGYSNSITKAVFSPDSRQVLTLSNEKNAKLWDISKGTILKIVEETTVIKDAVFSQDGKKLLINSEAGQVKLLNLISGETVFTLEEKEIHMAAFSPGGERIIAAADSSVYIYDVLSRKKVNRFTEHNSISVAGVSRNGNYLYYVFGKSALTVVELATGKIFRDYLGEEEIAGCEFSPDSKYILLLGGNGTARLLETATGKRIEEFSKRSDVEYGVPRIGGYYYENLWESSFQHFSSDRKYLVFRTYFDNYIVVRRMSDLAVVDSIFSVTGFNNLITDAAFVPPANFLVTGSRDDTVRIWNYYKNKFRIVKKIPANGFEVSPDGKWLLLINNVQLVFYDLQKQRPLFSTLAMNETDYFTQLAGKPYYAASRNAAKNLGFRLGDRYFSFDQFDLQLNRPDIVLAGIDHTDTMLITSYKNAWNKRIKRSGFRARELSANIHLPLLKLNGIEPYGITHEPALTLRFTASDNLYNLDRYRISVNEVPLGGVKGFNLKEYKSKKISKEVQVPLSTGKNSISISCVNEKGDESFKTNLLLTFHPLTVLPEPQTFFFGIGIDQFADAKLNLRYCVKDIRDLSVKLKEKYKHNIIIDSLFNEQVSVSHVKALKQKLQQTTVNDKVIIAYSGHGLLSKTFDYYLSTHTVNFEQPEKNGLSYDELENLLDGIPARKKLMLLDACHSGEVDKEELIRIDAVDTSRLKKGGKPMVLKPNAPHLGMKNSFELMQSLFVNVGKSTGATIISAAAGTQFALERGDLKNGVFTYSILEAMDKNPTMKISELKKIVGQRVEQLTNGLQKPTSRNETIAVDWNLW